MTTDRFLPDAIDQALALAVQNPLDRGAVADLYTAVWPRAFALAYRVLRGSKMLAEDVTQSVLVRVLLSPTQLSRIADAHHLRRLLDTSIQRSCLDLFRVERRWEFVDIMDPGFLGSDAHPADLGAGDDRVDAAIALRRIHRELLTFPKVDQVLVQMLVEGRSREEMARAIGRDESGLAVRLFRVRQKLRKSLPDGYLGATRGTTR